MKAVVMTQPGDPEVLELREIPTPEIRHATQMRVRLAAAGVNPVDTKLRQRGTYFPDRMPAVLGCDGAGTVEEIGSGVTRYQPGDAVYFCYGGIGDPPGTYAQYAVIDQDHAAPKPATIDFAHAAALPLVLITAWEALHERAHTRDNDTVLIHAGAGGVGHVAVQLAARAGARVATTVSDDAKAAFVRELGAEHVIPYRDTDFVEDIGHWTDTRGVDIALDTVGGDVFSKTVSAVKQYGDLVTLLQPPADADWKTARLRNLRVGFELMLTPMYLGQDEHLRRHAEILRRGARMIDAGELRVHLAETLPLASAAQAHRRIEQGSMQGKLVLGVD